MTDINQVTETLVIQDEKKEELKPLTEKQIAAIAKWTVYFGKHKDKTYGWIVENDKSYAKWMATIVKSDRVKQYLNQVLEE